MLFALAVAAALVCLVGYFTNAWAAWAPPGVDGANHAWRVASARYFVALSFCFLVLAVLTIFLGNRIQLR